MFIDPKNPSMNELIYYMMISYPTLVKDMHTAEHAYCIEEPNPYHTGDNSIWTHTMMVCLRAENEDSNKIVKICALLHDIGKPLSRGVIPFMVPKPVHSESNQIRNDGKHDGKESGLNNFTDREFKIHFRGHEGLSFHLAIEILNKLEALKVVDEREKISILTIISLHGALFDNVKDGQEYKPHNVVSKFNDLQIYRDFVQQVKNDSMGRFYTSKDGRKNNAIGLGDTYYNDETFLKNQLVKPTNAKTYKITLLVGLPNSGKSTWRSYNVLSSDITISRNDILMRYAEDNIFEPEVKTYSQVWKYLEEHDLHGEVDKIEQQIFQTAVRERKNIIIDRTNMSRKSRRKWLHSIPKNYVTEAIVFATDLNEIGYRNNRRAFTEGKNIPEDVILNMSKSFMVPMYDEFDIIQWKF